MFEDGIAIIRVNCAPFRISFFRESTVRGTGSRRTTKNLVIFSSFGMRRIFLSFFKASFQLLMK